MDAKKVGTAEVIGGMALVLLGHRNKGLAMFGHGFYNLEQEYRKANPELEPGLKARWQASVNYYEETHRDETNRNLHRLGIPVIVGGAVGLLTLKPYQKPWFVAALAFALGWVSNIVGHGMYEKNRPAFTEDPLSFIAGPVWDWKQMVARQKAESSLQQADVIVENV